jgi:hypothetical protein
MLVGGVKYVLIFVDRATKCNWCFGLKSLSRDDIIAASLAFWAEACSLVKQFRCDCDEKLVGSHIRSFLHLGRSSIIASPAGQQSTHGLVDSHWKIMVHMARAFFDREANTTYILVFHHQAFRPYDEYDPQQVSQEASLSLHACSWCAPGPKNLAPFILAMLLSPQERQ